MRPPITGPGSAPMTHPNSSNNYKKVLLREAALSHCLMGEGGLPTLTMGVGYLSWLGVPTLAGAYQPKVDTPNWLEGAPPPPR